MTFVLFIINTESRKKDCLMLCLQKPVKRQRREEFLSLKVSGTNWRALEQVPQCHWNNEGYLFSGVFYTSKSGNLVSFRRQRTEIQSWTKKAANNDRSNLKNTRVIVWANKSARVFLNILERPLIHKYIKTTFGGFPIVKNNGVFLGFFKCRKFYVTVKVGVHCASLDTLEVLRHCTHYESVNLINVSKQLVHGTTVLHGKPAVIT